MKSIFTRTVLNWTAAAIVLTLGSATIVLAQAMCHPDPAAVAAVKASDAKEAAEAAAAATAPTTQDSKQAAAATAPTTQDSKQAARPINTKCPISGDDIDPSITEVYDGKVIGFCCPDCVKTFNKDPKKYMAGLK